jgi:hypothetical protein
MVDEIDFTILERIKKKERERAERIEKVRKLGEKTRQEVGGAGGASGDEAGGEQAQMQSLFSIFDAPAPLAMQEQAAAQQTQQMQSTQTFSQNFSQDLVFQKLLEIYDKISKMEEVLNSLKQKIDGKE